MLYKAWDIFDKREIIQYSDIQILNRSINIRQADIPQIQKMQPHNKIHTYYNNKQVTSVSDLPIPFRERSMTDIFCTIITALFAIAMFVTACVVFNGQKLGHITYPTDGMGRKCTLDNPTYNYLYFTSVNDPAKRVCVSECPKGTQQQLKCLPLDNLSCGKNSNTNFEVQIYPSVAEQTSIGLYCFPTDDALKERLLVNSNLDQRFDFVKSYRSIWISAGVAFALGFIFLIMMCFCTRPMLYVSIILGGLSFIAVAIILIIMNASHYRSYSPLVYILSALFIIFGIMLLSSLIFKRNDLRLCGQYLARGVTVLRKQKILFLVVPVFIALTVGLIALCWFQLLAYWSHSNLVFRTNQVYYAPQGTFAWLMQFLDLVQFIWGLCFLKQAYNFIVSSCAVTFYFLKDSYIMHGIKGLFRFHWGSVVASSFLLNFFYLPDIIYDFIKPSQTNRGCYKCFTSVCCCCDRLFGFARSQTMAFINAVGLPYCNSSRWCQKINYLSKYFDGSQSVFRYFSLGSHIMLAVIATAIGFLYSTATGSTPHQLALLFSLALNLFVVTYFVSLVKNLAESILMCTLIEQYLTGQNMYEQAADSSVSSDDRKQTANFNQNRGFQQSNVNEGYEILPTRPH